MQKLQPSLNVGTARQRDPRITPLWTCPHKYFTVWYFPATDLKLKRLPVLLWTNRLMRGIGAFIKSEKALDGTAGHYRSYKEQEAGKGPCSCLLRCRRFSTPEFYSILNKWKKTRSKSWREKVSHRVLLSTTEIQSSLRWLKWSSQCDGIHQTTAAIFMGNQINTHRLPPASPSTLKAWCINNHIYFILLLYE